MGDNVSTIRKRAEEGREYFGDDQESWTGIGSPEKNPCKRNQLECGEYSDKS